MNKGPHYLLFGGGIAVLLLAAVACTDIKPVEDRVGAAEQSIAAAQAKLTSLEGKVGKIAAPAGKVEYTVRGVEIKGATSTDSLAAPTSDPAKLSDGYRYKGPGVFEPANPKRWEVSTYIWTPGAITALQGDQVNLRIFIINGDKHTTWVEGPDGKEVVKEEVQNRGREYLMTFTASQVGTYKLICNEHDPTMRAVITALPRS
ncbi:MAG: hypothetical protein HYU30_04040 [Chloroflexi bacterium]|nr:hypothetical protein [Chloroflexota bacterium]